MTATDTVRTPPAPVPGQGTLLPRPPFAAGVGILAAASLFGHLAAALLSPYGVHRDEFLYMAMGRHLRVFAMEFPPLIAVLSEASRLLGDSLLALRLTPAIAGAALVLLAGAIARELGGGRPAQLLAAFAWGGTPLALRTAALFQPVVFDQLWWTLGLYALVRLGREAGETAGSVPEPTVPGPARSAVLPSRSRWWLVLGLAAGLGLLTKFSILFFGAAVLAGLLVTPARRALAGPGPWLALLLALVVGSPSFVGQIRLDWPVVGQMGDLQESQLARVGYGDFVLGQVMMFGPAFLLAVTGAAALVAWRPLRSFRVVGWTGVAAFLLLMSLHGKPYYIGPVYPALLASGSVLVERVAERLRRRGRRGWSRAALWGPTAAVAAYFLITLPLGLPVLPPAPMARYSAALGITGAVTTNRGEVLPLPQDYADMLGWREKVDTVAAVYHRLPERDRERTVIIAENYGQAGAIDFYGPARGLPPAVSATGSYWFFGPGEKPGEVVIHVGGTAEDLRPYCGSLERAAVSDPAWVVPEERDLPIWICRDPPRTLQELWPLFRGQN